MFRSSTLWITSGVCCIADIWYLSIIVYCPCDANLCPFLLNQCFIIKILSVVLSWTCGRGGKRIFTEWGEYLIMRITLNDVSQVWKKSREVHLPKNITSTVKHGRCYSWEHNNTLIFWATNWKGTESGTSLDIQTMILSRFNESMIGDK